MTDVELLTIREGMVLDNAGRVAGMRGVAIAVARDGARVWPGALLPDELAETLVTIVASSGRPLDPSQAPPALAACERAMEAVLGEPTVRRGGPCYVFPRDVHATASSARIVRSDAIDVDGLRAANPGNWEATEWDDLLHGRLGPWAMALSGGEVLSICHTPVRMTEEAAECGVWTRPDARGRGYASATASAWAEVLGPRGQHLFYQHDAENVSSRRVTQRLGLRPIGWVWQARTDEPPARGHPLSSQAAGSAG